MEVHEQFYEDSKLQGKKREEVIKIYIELKQKSNLVSYLRCHLSDAQWIEIQPFLDEISKRIANDYITKKDKPNFITRCNG